MRELSLALRAPTSDNPLLHGKSFTVESESAVKLHTLVGTELPHTCLLSVTYQNTFTFLFQIFKTNLYTPDVKWLFYFSYQPCLGCLQLVKSILINKTGLQLCTKAVRVAGSHSHQQLFWRYMNQITNIIFNLDAEFRCHFLPTFGYPKVYRILVSPSLCLEIPCEDRMNCKRWPSHDKTNLMASIGNAARWGYTNLTNFPAPWSVYLVISGFWWNHNSFNVLKCHFCHFRIYESGRISDGR